MKINQLRLLFFAYVFSLLRVILIKRYFRYLGRMRPILRVIFHNVQLFIFIPKQMKQMFDIEAYQSSNLHEDFRPKHPTFNIRPKTKIYYLRHLLECFQAFVLIDAIARINGREFFRVNGSIVGSVFQVKHEVHVSENREAKQK